MASLGGEGRGYTQQALQSRLRVLAPQRESHLFEPVCEKLWAWWLTAADRERLGEANAAGDQAFMSWAGQQANTGVSE